MTRLLAFLKMSRPHFLIGGAVMYAVGALSNATLSVGTYLLGQAVVSCVQLTAHYVNEYADVEFDRAVTNRTMFSGGSGVLSSGELPPQVALRSAFTTSMMALIGSATLVSVSPFAAALTVVALIISWAYSMPPARLLNTGWGELVTATVVGGMVPAVGALVNGGSIDRGVVAVAIVLILINVAVVLAFEIPDVETDRATDKRVLAVRIGTGATIRLMAGLFGAASVLTFVGVAADTISANWLTAVAAVPAASTIVAAARANYQLLTASAVAALTLFGMSLVWAAA